MIEFLLALIIMTFVITLLIAIVYIVANTYDILELRNSYCCVVLSFSQFIKFYNLNPKAYELNDCYVIRNYCTETTIGKYMIVFSIIDTFKYKIFKHILEKEEIKNDNDKLKLDYIKSVQRDIDKLSEQAEEAISKAKEELKL